MDNTLPSPDTPKTDAAVEQETPAEKRNKELKEAVDTCKQYRRKLIQTWAVNVDYRRGKPFASQSDEDRISVNLDWSLTKQKQALLFSNFPQIRISHPPQSIMPEVSPWLHNYEQRVNDIARESGMETAIDECMPDCINAAGLGIVMVAREAITLDKKIPIQDLSIYPPEVAAQIETAGVLPDGTPLEFDVVPEVIDSRYCVTRVSPADFLWPIDFTGSDFNQAPWIGRSGRLTWAEAVARFKLDESKKAEYTGAEDRNMMDRLNTDVEKDQAQTYEVAFDEVFFREYKYDPASKSFSRIWHLVFIGNKAKPVIDEPWNGQQEDPEAKRIIGSLRYPITVLTLSYLTDEAIPPSDSAIGRPQVNELNKSRTHMMLQREHSRPVRWFDVNRIDPMIQQALMRGTWQHMIPVQGSGVNVIGEISRSAMPQENYIFDGVIKTDLGELWQVGQGQTGDDIETKAEVNAIQGNMQTRIGRERARVGRFVCNIGEVLGGLIALYEDPTIFGEGFKPSFSTTLAYSILVDSTVLLDAKQRYQQLENFYNFAIKTGWLVPDVILKEMATLVGLDPNVAIQPPKPKPPVEPNISLRLSGTEDLLNPLAYAFLLKSGQAPDPKLIEEAKQHIQLSVIPPPGTVMPMAPVTGPDGKPQEQSAADKVPLPLGPGPSADSMMPAPPPAPPAIGKAFPELSAADRVNQRVLER